MAWNSCELGVGGAGPPLCLLCRSSTRRSLVQFLSANLRYAILVGGSRPILLFSSGGRGGGGGRLVGLRGSTFRHESQPRSQREHFHRQREWTLLLHKLHRVFVYAWA